MGKRRGAFAAESPDHKIDSGDPWNLIRLTPAEGAEMSFKWTVFSFKHEPKYGSHLFPVRRRGLNT